MLFNTAIFGLFFVAFFVVFKLLARTRTQKLWTITIGSLVFYAGWNPKFVPLLVGTALFDFYVARAIQRETRPGRRKALVAASVVLNLGVLGFFKYAGFFAQSASVALGAIGVHVAIPAVAVVLPVGISFYTFQSLSYTIDVYRAELRAREKPVEFLAAVSFFPHLVAGPIIRASTLLPQFEEFPTATWKQVERGYLLVCVGLFKKTIADLLARSADGMFNAGGHHTPLEAWTGALAFTGQIYGDFSGYTDIAIGVALLLGFVLPANFDAPYVARSPVDFWRRWHISLSTWLRDYLYISLGGNRNHRYRNLMLTMLLGGLWHGAGWTFVLWGAYHGLLLVASHGLAHVLPKLSGDAAPKLVRLGKIALTFYLVVLGWVLFRAPTIGVAATMLGDMHVARVAAPIAPQHVIRLVVTILGIVLCHRASRLAVERETSTRAAAVLRWNLAGLCILFTVVAGTVSQAFIYFQF